MTAPAHFTRSPVSAASPKPGVELDLAITWEVVVVDGDGWPSQDNVFRGCRVDYTVPND